MEEIHQKVSVGGCVYFWSAGPSAWGFVRKCWVGGFFIFTDVWSPQNICSVLIPQSFSSSGREMFLGGAVCLWLGWRCICCVLLITEVMHKGG